MPIIITERDFQITERRHAAALIIGGVCIGDIYRFGQEGEQAFNIYLAFGNRADLGRYERGGLARASRLLLIAAATCDEADRHKASNYGSAKQARSV